MLRHYLPRRTSQSGHGRHRLTRRSTLTVRTLAARFFSEYSNTEDN